MPKIFRLTKGGKLIEGIFKGATINTPSMLCVVDYLDALSWVKNIGGLGGSIDKSKHNLAVVKAFVEDNDWVEFLAQSQDTISNTSICLTLDASENEVKSIVKLLEKESVAYDIGAYRDAPTGIRIWGGATVEASDLEKLSHWITWAYNKIVNI